MRSENCIFHNCLKEEKIETFINQLLVLADYDGVGSKGTKFVFYM